MRPKIAIILIIIFILTGCGKQSTFVSVNLSAPVLETKITNQPKLNQSRAVKTNTNQTTTSPVPVKVEIPSKLELKVAFAPQAPFGNWDELHEEACEEASMIIAAKYFSNQPLDEAIMEEEIIKLDKWEKDHSYKIDLSAEETAQVLRNYFKLSAQVSAEVSVDRIKYELSQGNLIIVPAAGRALQNPYFRSPGPIYHMLVIKGYNNSEFIVNEVGTKRGDSFKYKYQTLLNAIHDWEPTWSHYEITDEQMNAQPKRMVIVNK